MKFHERIRRLESKVSSSSADGRCRRPFSGAVLVVWPDGRRTNHGPCPRCGGERVTLVVLYDEE
jgi:hypothetical protein